MVTDQQVALLRQRRMEGKKQQTAPNMAWQMRNPVRPRAATEAGQDDCKVGEGGLQRQVSERREAC